MTFAQFTQSLTHDAPPHNLSAPVRALWYDARGDWSRAHSKVDHLESTDAMAVRAYLHRKEGDNASADYRYRRSTTMHRRPTLEAEWRALANFLLT